LAHAPPKTANLSVIRSIVNAYEDLADAQVRRAAKALKAFQRQIAKKAMRLFHDVGRVGVFVSYSHQDERWCREVQAALADLHNAEQIAYFDDTGLAAGEDWARKITRSIDTASIAVLLVSEHFLQSRFIIERELPRIHDRYRRSNLEMIPVLVDGEIPETLWIRDLQFLKTAHGPLATANLQSREQAMAELAARVGKTSCSGTAK
jgi:hypothetical protein